MQFTIKVIDVSNSTAVFQKGKNTGKSYAVSEVTYKDLGQDGKVISRKLTDFGHAAQKVISQATKDQVYTITASKKEGSEYWDWDKAELGNEFASTAAAPTVKAGATAAYAPKSNYPTSDERAATQRQINRSAGVARAIEFLTAQARTFTLVDVFTVSKEIEKYVTTDGVEGIKNMEDDVPL